MISFELCGFSNGSGHTVVALQNGDVMLYHCLLLYCIYQVQSPDLDMLQEEEDNAFEVDNPPRRRKSSRSLKVVPSPNSTLERKKTEEGGGGGGGGHVSFKEPTSFTKSPSKSKQRTKSEDIHKKGLLGVRDYYTHSVQQSLYM